MNLDINKIADNLEESSSKITKIDNENLSVFGKKINILYLEDEENDAELMKEILDVEYLNIDIAKNYNLALSKFELMRYQAFIVDVVLNDRYDGFDFIDFLQKNEIKNIIVVTGVKNDSIKQKCLEKDIRYIYEKSDLFKIIQSNSYFLEDLLLS